MRRTLHRGLVGRGRLWVPAWNESGAAKCELRVPPASQPNVVLRLSEAVKARGVYGMTRQVSSIALAVDDPDGFVRALTENAG